MSDADEIFPDDDASDEIKTPARKPWTLLIRAALLLGMAATVASAFTGGGAPPANKAADKPPAHQPTPSR